MPLPWWAVGAASAAGRIGGGFLQNLFGNKEEQGYQMSPGEKRLSDVLWQQYEGDVPGHITAPFARAAKGIKQHYKRQPGSSGVQHAVLQRQAYTPMAQAGSRYKKGLLGTIMSLVKGTGTQTATGSTPWGDILGGGAEDFGFLWGLEQMMGNRKQQYQPAYNNPRGGT